MASKVASIKSALEQLTANKTASDIRVHFPDVTITQAGQHVTRAQSAHQPSLSICSSSITSSHTSSSTFLAICLDLDPPYPTCPFLGPLAHCVLADLRLGAAATDQEGWTRLESSSGEGEKPLVSYAPPSPPPLSAPHRYLVMLFEQPRGVSGVEIRGRMGLPEEVGIVPRLRWDQAGFERKAGLGAVVACSYFCCS